MNAPDISHAITTAFRAQNHRLYSIFPSNDRTLYTLFLNLSYLGLFCFTVDNKEGDIVREFIQQDHQVDMALANKVLYGDLKHIIMNIFKSQKRVLSRNQFIQDQKSMYVSTNPLLNTITTPAAVIVNSIMNSRYLSIFSKRPLNPIADSFQIIYSTKQKIVEPEFSEESEDGPGGPGGPDVSVYYSIIHFKNDIITVMTELLNNNVY